MTAWQRKVGTVNHPPFAKFYIIRIAGLNTDALGTLWCSLSSYRIISHGERRASGTETGTSRLAPQTSSRPDLDQTSPVVVIPLRWEMTVMALLFPLPRVPRIAQVPRCIPSSTHLSLQNRYVLGYKRPMYPLLDVERPRESTEPEASHPRQDGWFLCPGPVSLPSFRAISIERALFTTRLAFQTLGTISRGAENMIRPVGPLPWLP